MQTPPALNAHQQRPIIFIIALAAFMGALDTSIVNISLPSIATYFHEDIGDVSRVVMSYGLVIACLLLVFGKLGDGHGFRKVYIGGFAVFTVGSLLCDLSMTLGHLVDFRLLQGLGAAALEAVGPAMIAHYLPQTVRGTLATAVFLLYASLTTESGLFVIVLALALLGATSGLYFPPNMNQVLGQSPKGEEGVASSVMQTAKNIGDVLGVAVFGTVFIQAIVSAFAHRDRGRSPHPGFPCRLHCRGGGLRHCRRPLPHGAGQAEGMSLTPLFSRSGTAQCIRD
ncbi:MAG: MFS transporter [Methanofollis sp.]|uniref:MFS transporter n=1 Tax=Methanofollis sp. TaxID=2052835 RepID=UPI00260FC17B|nr:MFS transporter [Methanofollis sp.]MDD4254732.1 MFS transporter [Methanofollis sp.]